MRELVPTVNVWRGPGAPSAFGPPGDLAEAAIDQLAFTDMQGRARRWEESLPDTYTDGPNQFFGTADPNGDNSTFTTADNQISIQGVTAQVGHANPASCF